MPTAKGTWTRETVAGHPCDVFAPARCNRAGFVLLYLHGVHLADLREKTPFVQQFEQHGLPVVAPITGRSWWTHRICPVFDPAISAER